MTREEIANAPYIHYDDHMEAFRQARKESEAKSRAREASLLHRPGISPSWPEMGRKAALWLSAGLLVSFVLGFAVAALVASAGILWRLVVDLVVGL